MLPNRREFLRSAASLAGTQFISPAPQGPPKKKVAALISEYRPNSHADVIVGKILEGHYYAGQAREPGVQLVSMYTDQVPDEDMSRELSFRHRFRILPSIREALTMTSNTSVGPRSLAVDGILLICEHGAYPYNPLGQKMYPRYEFFKQVVDVFRETGQAVPVFNDKHLSYEWHKAKWMYDQSRELRFPFMAGSVLPLARDPKARVPLGIRLEKAVLTWEATFFDAKDSYGFHALERLQSQVERRDGGETGVAAVQCFQGDDVWEWTGKNAWAEQLLTALGPKRTGPLRGQVKDPLLFVVQYRSGLEAVVYRLNGYPTAQSFAALEAGKAQPLLLNDERGDGSPVSLPPDLRTRYRHNHFSAVVHLFEQMVLTGRVPHPVERTLLTSGVLAALHESSYQPSPMYGLSMQHGTHLSRGRLIQTPQLGIRYQVSEQDI